MSVAICFRLSLNDLAMSKVTLRVKHAGGQSVVKGLEQTDSLEKLISHSLEALGMTDAAETPLRLLAGFPPKARSLKFNKRKLNSRHDLHIECIFILSLFESP